MKVIKILGTGCPKCKTMVKQVEQVVRDLGIEAEVIKVEDIEAILRYDVLSTPVLVLDEVIKIKGRVPSMEELKEILK